MNKLILTTAFQLLIMSAFAQNLEPYAIYNAKGKQVKYKKMVKQLIDTDILLFGEQHNNAIAHWLQYEVTNDLSKHRFLTLGAEMFEADNQDILDQYLNGEIDAKGLDSLARLWKNYDTDYAPLVDFAKNNELAFIATNIPRRYANMVYKNDFNILDDLTEEEKSWIAPLPIRFDPELPQYKNILTMMGDHGSPAIVKAQAMKDATMAHFIVQNFHQGRLFIHYNGAYHSDKYEGILWYLEQDDDSLNYKTISTVNQKDVSFLEEEYLNRADYIIVVDSNMTTTY